MVTPADITDRDAAKEVLFRLRLMHPEITIVWAAITLMTRRITRRTSRTSRRTGRPASLEAQRD